MEKKRSNGVTFWGWVFIVVSIPRLFYLSVNLQQEVQDYGNGLIFLWLFSDLAYLVCGIFILKLNEKARVAVIALCIINIFISRFYLYVEITNSEEYQMFINMTNQEASKYTSEELPTFEEYINKYIRTLFIFLVSIIFILELIPIYFFTRPRVKEQFK